MSKSIAKRHAIVCLAFFLLLGTIVATLYLQDRRREWAIRVEQANHRFDLVKEIFSRELDGVRSDALFLAEQAALLEFVQGARSQLARISEEYVRFVRHKGAYDQIRLLDLSGRETIRVNYAGGKPISVPPRELQDKSDRYYFEQGLSLRPGEIFVSEFDLNVEHGELEVPLKPVIRFVTPVADDSGEIQAYLVLNLLGIRFLQELDNLSIPGSTLLLRPDGHYIHSDIPDAAWGWLLGNERTFARRFPNEWSLIDKDLDCTLTENGAFAATSISLGASNSQTIGDRDAILVVSYLPRDQVFSHARALLTRLLALGGGVMVAFVVLARFWASAMVTRQLQNEKIAVSEERLRELSHKLLRIQEDERRAISREIHDELGQQVTAINLDLKLAHRNTDPRAASREHLDRAIRENEGLLQSLHAFAHRVRPAALDDLGLRDALETHLSEFQQRTRIRVSGDLSFDSREIPGEIADHVYRLIQEALNNVAKHANATRVSVRLAIDHRVSPKQFLISICDNGRGYEGNEPSVSRLGLVGMQERVDLMAGNLTIKSTLDEGVQIRISLPFPDGGAGPRKSYHETYSD